MPDVQNLREKTAKSVLTIADGYGCGIFCGFFIHLQCMSHSRDGSI